MQSVRSEEGLVAASRKVYTPSRRSSWPGRGAWVTPGRAERNSLLQGRPWAVNQRAPTKAARKTAASTAARRRGRRTGRARRVPAAASSMAARVRLRQAGEGRRPFMALR